MTTATRSKEKPSRSKVTFETNAPAIDAQPRETKPKEASKRAKASKKIVVAKTWSRAKTPKPTAERSNKKAEVIAMMKCANGATMAEIVQATGWQKHTVRGFVSILGSKGGEKIESTKNAAVERAYRIEVSNRP